MTILQADQLSKTYIREGFLGARLGKVQALKGISFRVKQGDILGVVGESGSGKTTLAKIICSLENPTSGSLVWKIPVGKRIHPAQMVFQNPFNSLNPKLTIGYSLKEAVACSRQGKVSSVKESEVSQLLDRVGLEGINISSYPHQFSGGQRQRIVIARALALKPHILVCDEPVSALDISVQAQIINLLLDINREMKLTIIFIAHDIEAVSMVSKNIMVMSKGEIVEQGEAAEVIWNPKKEYTRMLIDAVPANPWLEVYD